MGFDFPVSLHASTMWPDQRWEELRKEARRLEHDVDAKLVQLSKFGAQVVSGSAPVVSHSFLSRQQQDEQPLLDQNSFGASRHDKYRVLVGQIETMLARLTHLNDEMSSRCSNNLSAISGTPIMHTQQRHRDILQDYMHEFNKSKANIETFLNRDELLLNASNRDYSQTTSSPTASDSGGQSLITSPFSNRRYDLLSKESDHLRHSERLIDEQIEIASATKENLRSQRRTLAQTFTRVANIKQRFPALSSLMTRIGIRKRQESIILGILIGVCIIVLLWVKLG